MKPTIYAIAIGLVMCGIAMRVDKSAQTQISTTSKTPSPPLAATPGTTRTVSYNGVSFTYDSSLASDVEFKTVPLREEGQPADVVPEHPSFTLAGYPGVRNGQPSEPQIKVFSVAGFRSALHNESTELAKVTYPPMADLGPAVDTEVRVLKELVKAKPTLPKLDRFLAKARGQQNCSAAMPFLPMWAACMAFVSHLKYVDFKNGRGVVFLTQWNTETFPITNDGLEYAYQGISNDGRYWIYAEFAVNAPFLRGSDAPEVIAWAEKNYLLSHR